MRRITRCRALAFVLAFVVAFSSMPLPTAGTVAYAQTETSESEGSSGGESMSSEDTGSFEKNESGSEDDNGSDSSGSELGSSSESSENSSDSDSDSSGNGSESDHGSDENGSDSVGSGSEAGSDESGNAGGSSGSSDAGSGNIGSQESGAAGSESGGDQGTESSEDIISDNSSHAGQEAGETGSKEAGNTDDIQMSEGSESTGGAESGSAEGFDSNESDSSYASPENGSEDTYASDDPIISISTEGDIPGTEEGMAESVVVIEEPVVIDEGDYYCGLEEHEHDEECFRRILVLKDPETVHVHTKDCYTAATVCICGEEEHKHTKRCFDEEYWENYDEYVATSGNAPRDPEDGTAIHGQKEHVHDISCVRKYYTDKLICGYDAEGWPEDPDEYQALMDEADPENGIFPEPSHIHDKDCYEWQYVLVCGEAEWEKNAESIEEDETESSRKEDHTNVIEVGADEEESLLQEEELSESTLMLLYPDYEPEWEDTDKAAEEEEKEYDDLEDFDIAEYIPISRRAKLRMNMRMSSAGGLMLLGAANGSEEATEDDGMTEEDDEAAEDGDFSKADSSSIEERTKSRIEPNSQEPVTGDGITIEKLSIRWISKSSGESTSAKFDPLYLEPDTDIVPNQQFQIDFATSGKGNIEAGDIEIVMPAYIWLDRDGNEPGLLTLAVPREGESSNSDFAWKRVGDYIVITNVNSVSAGSKFMIQGTFRMTSPDPNADPTNFTSTYAHQMVDVDVTGSSEYADHDYTGISDPLYAVVNIVTPREREELTMTSNDIFAVIDTKVVVSSATKTAAEPVYANTPEEMPKDLPEELLDNLPGGRDTAGDYYYVKWYVDGRIDGNQPFTMTTTDTARNDALIETRISDSDNKYNPPEDYTVHAIMLGATDTYTGDELHPGPVSMTEKDADGISKTVRDVPLYKGYTDVDKACYIWTAYPKSDFTEAGAIYTLKNTQTITVTGLDDKVVTTMDASAEVKFRAPIIWKIDKVWNDDDNAKGRRPLNIFTYVENHSDHDKRVTSATLSDSNGWHYEWKDDGSVSNYEAMEVDYWVSHNTWTPVKYYDENGRYVTAEGYGEWEEYADGMRRRYHWWYSREKTVFDNQSHTWTFTNKYHEAWEYGNVAILSLQKHATNHTNNRQDATSDRDLVYLRDHLETTEINYNVSSSSMMMAYTAEEGADLNDVTKHHQRYVTLDLRDYGIQFEGRALRNDEYYIKGVTLEDPVVWEWNPKESGETDYTNAGAGSWKTVDTVPVKILGLTAAGGEWVEYGEINHGTVTALNGATVSGKRVNFPEEVSEVKESLYTNADRASLSYNIHVILKPTEDVREAVEKLFSTTDYAMGRSYNYVDSILSNDDGEIMKLTRGDATYLHGRNYRAAADLRKTSKYLRNNSDKQQLEFENTVTLIQQSNIVSRDEYQEAVTYKDVPDGTTDEEGNPNIISKKDIPTSESGVFYDLLPAGMTADEASFTIVGGEIKNIDIIENYHESGRQLIKVTADITAEPKYATREDPKSPYYGDATYPINGYGTTASITFKALYSWEEARARGLFTEEEARQRNQADLVNTAAYEADEEEFGNVRWWSGEKDAPYHEAEEDRRHKKSNSAVHETLRGLMTNLDPDNDNPNFVYARAYPDLTEIDFSADTNIRKHVQAMGQDSWTYGHNDEVNVYEGGKYSYRIRLGSGADTTTDNIIILDSIEAYLPVEVTDPGDTDFELGQIVSRRELEYKNTALDEGKTPAEGKDVWYWKGYFRSIDVTPMTEADWAGSTEGSTRPGPAPVVYYSTVPGLDISHGTVYGDASMSDPANYDIVYKWLHDHELNGETDNSWSTEMPEDPSDVTAIAIDCRLNENGERFELKENEFLVAYIYMQAPYYSAEDAGEKYAQPEAFDPDNYFNFLKNAHAYNNVYMDVQQVTEAGTRTHSYDHFDYTKVGIMGADLKVVKVWDDLENNDGKRPDSVSLNLFRNGEDTGRTVTLTAGGLDGDTNTTEDNWRDTLDHVLIFDEDGNHYQYSFVENLVDGYASKSVVAANEETITIDVEDDDGEPVTKEYKVRRYEATVTNTHEPEKTNVPFRKVWANGDPGNDNWEQNIPASINVRLYKDLGQGPVYTGINKSVRAGEDGSWSGEFTDLLKYEGGKLIHYTVDETSVPDNFIKTVELEPVSEETDTGSEGAGTDDTGTGSETSQELQEEQKYVTVITNTYYPYSDLTATKIVKDATTKVDELNKEFEFSLTLRNRDNTPLTRKYNYWIIDKDATLVSEDVTDEEGNTTTVYKVKDKDGNLSDAVEPVGTIGNGGVFKLHANEKIVVKDLPAGTVYSIKETPLAGFTQTGAAGASGTISSAHTSDAVVTNTYSSRGQADVYAQKSLSGMQQLKNYVFRFELQEPQLDDNGQPVMGEDGKPVMRTVRAATNKAGTEEHPTLGEVGFGAFLYNNFDSGKEYTYTMVETIRSDTQPWFVFDETEYVVKITPHDNGDGTMTCDVRYYDADGNEITETKIDEKTGEEIVVPKAPTFTNAYHAKGDLVPRAWKVLNGRELKDKEFRFELLDQKGANPYLDGSGNALIDEDGAEISNIAVNTEDGSVVFPALNYTESDIGKTYYYVAREIEPSGTEDDPKDPTVKYDKKVFGYKVEIADNGDGTLSITQTFAKPAYQYDEDGNVVFEQDEEGRIKFVDLPVGDASGLPVFTNTLEDGKFSISKLTRDSAGADPNQLFKFKVRLVGDKIDSESTTISYELEQVSETDVQGGGTSGTNAAPLSAASFLPLKTPMSPLTLDLALPEDSNTDIDSDFSDEVVNDMDQETETTEGSDQMTDHPEDPGQLDEAGDNTEPDGEVVSVISNGTEDNGKTEESESQDESVVEIVEMEEQEPEEAQNPDEEQNADTEEQREEAALIRGIRTVAATAWKSLTKAATFVDEALTITAYAADDDIASGTSGTCSWVIDANGVLTISPTNGTSGQLDSFTAVNYTDPAYKLPPWHGYREQISKVIVLPGVKTAAGCSHMFYGETKCTEMDLSGLDTSAAENMQHMFCGSSACESLDLSTFNTSNVTYMYAMFYRCNNLQFLDISSFDTSNITSSGMGFIFNECRNLKAVKLSPGMIKWPGSPLPRPSIEGCTGKWIREGEESGPYSGPYTPSELQSNYINHPSEMAGTWVWEVIETPYAVYDDTTNTLYFVRAKEAHSNKSQGTVHSISGGEYTGTIYTGFEESSWNMLSQQTWYSINNNVKSVKVIDNIKPKSIAYWFCQFRNCTEFDLAKLDTSRVTNMSGVFAYCISLTNLNLSTFNTNNVTSMHGMFERCRKLTSLDLSGFNTGNTTSMSNMFIECSGLKSIKLGERFSFKGKNITNTSNQALLPTPSGSQYTGKWMRDDGAYDSYTPAQLRDNYISAMAGTWVWEPKYDSYTIKFDGNSGSGSMPNLKADITKVKVLPSNLFLKFDHEFEGWSVNGAEGPVVYRDGATIPANTYKKDQVVTLTAIWKRNEHNVTMENGEFELELHAFEKAVFDNIPAGTAYQVWEETPDGWVLIQQVGASGTIEPKEEAKAIFTNKYEPDVTTAQFSGTKTLDGKAASAGAYSFTLDADKETGRSVKIVGDNGESTSTSLPITVSTMEGGFVQFPTIIYEEAGTYNYKIREVDPKDPKIDYDMHTETVTVDVSQADSGLKSKVTYDDDGIRFTNKTRPGTLKLTKQVENQSDANKNDRFTFRITFYNENGAPIGNDEKIYYYIATPSNFSEEESDTGE